MIALHLKGRTHLQVKISAGASHNRDKNKYNHREKQINPGQDKK